MIPTIRFQILKYSQGNYVQLFWGELTKGQHEAGAEQHKLGTTGGTTRGQAHRHPPIRPKPPQPTHLPSQPRPRDTHAQLGPTGGAWATPPTPPPKGLTCASKGPGTHPSGPSHHSQHIHQASHGLVTLTRSWARQVAVLTRRCAAGPDRWSMGDPAHTATQGVNLRIQGPRHPPITPKPPQPTHPPSQPRPRRALKRRGTAARHARRYP